jgi:hypothetical protein
VWVHGSKSSSLSLRCLSKNGISFLCAWFWNGALGSLQRLCTGAVTLKWDMGILLTEVTHGVCDPKELRATTPIEEPIRRPERGGVNGSR